MLAIQKYFLKWGGALAVVGTSSACWGVVRIVVFVRSVQSDNAPAETARDVFIRGLVLPHVALLMGIGAAVAGAIILLRAFVFKPAGLQRSLEKHQG